MRSRESLVYTPVSLGPDTDDEETLVNAEVYMNDFKEPKSSTNWLMFVIEYSLNGVKGIFFCCGTNFNFVSRCRCGRCSRARVHLSYKCLKHSKNLKKFKLLGTSSWVPRLTVHLNDLLVGVPRHARCLRRETRQDVLYASYLEEATTVAWKLFRAHGSSSIRIDTIFSRVGLRLIFFCTKPPRMYYIIHITDTIEYGTRKKLSRKRSKPLVL
ncbi:unnamed protein product [Trichogramma brassicae]|uniref:Uncharacterized protein n=1 Tax=Trichogramma brassicae TaxID=86971 RepID=A0A6H5I6I9_9HYME|nr:unnamed protein product [Trichogramma brassicae]